MEIPALFFQTLIIPFFAIAEEGSAQYTTWQQWLIATAQLIYSISLVRGIKCFFCIGYKYMYLKKAVDLQYFLVDHYKQMVLFTSAVLILMIYNRYLVGHQLVVVFIAETLLDMVKQSDGSNNGVRTINYGIGMACSFFEGYLNLVLPNDGSNNPGIASKITAFESAQRVRFPVRKLFLVVTKSLFCPPDLTDFNKPHRPDLAYLEGSTSLADLERNVAGVRNRQYRNSVYKIHRPGKPRPVPVVAECSTPLHTLYKVLQNRDLYSNLGNVNTEEVVRDFCTTLELILSRSPGCRDMCELIYYDDANPEENLADLILDRIGKIRNDYEEIIERIF